MNATAPRWRRGLFAYDIVHIQDDDAPVRFSKTRGRWSDAVCPRYVRVDTTEGDDTHRCPDCAEAARQWPAAEGPAPTAGG